MELTVRQLETLLEVAHRSHNLRVQIYHGNKTGQHNVIRLVWKDSTTGPQRRVVDEFGVLRKEQ